MKIKRDVVIYFWNDNVRFETIYTGDIKYLLTNMNFSFCGYNLFAIKDHDTINWDHINSDLFPPMRFYYKFNFYTSSQASIASTPSLDVFKKLIENNYFKVLNMEIIEKKKQCKSNKQ